MNDMSIIVPLDLSQRPLDISRKAVAMSESAERSRIPLIYSLNDKHSRHDRRLKKVLQKNRYTTLVTGEYYTGPANLSLLRNRAFEVVNTAFIALLDVDIWPDLALLEKYKNLISTGHRPFYFLPCMYLTAKGSQDLCRGKTTPQRLVDKYFSFSRREFLHLASPSSVTVMRSKDYTTIGQFNESYSGHGYEDFDFMMRLAQHHDALEPCSEMMKNTNARSPLFTSGFRRALGRLSIDALLSKDFVFHLYHQRPSLLAHKESRVSNYSIFLKCHDRHWGSATSKTLLEHFIEACRELEKNLEDYSALFENKPGHVDRFDTFKRRLRFLLND